MTKLARTIVSVAAAGNPNATASAVEYPVSVPGDGTYRAFAGTLMNNPLNYADEVRQCRYFYRYDPFASTVVNRMVDMASTQLRNRRGSCSDEEYAYYKAVAKQLNPILKTCALSYLVSGMAIIDYGLESVMGNTIAPRELGRKRYNVPSPLWVRPTQNIRLKRVPVSNERLVYLHISNEERYFIEHEGVRLDGTEDKAAYRALVRQFPKIVQLIKSGVHEIHLENAHPILRKIMPEDDYPQPFLVPALAPMKHKMRIKEMDYAIASRALEAIRQIKVGDKDFPVTEDDDALDDIRTQMLSRNRTGGDMVYNLFTNHTVEIQWIFPPLDALMSDAKYQEPNADIFVAMGFSRVLLVGEAFRSNSGQSTITTLGPVAGLNEMRASILDWIVQLYARLARLNGFRQYPEPSLAPIASADVLALIGYALEAHRDGVLSKNTLSNMFSTDAESERQQRKAELEADAELEDIVAKQQQAKLQAELQIQHDAAPDENSGPEAKPGAKPGAKPETRPGAKPGAAKSKKGTSDDE